MLLGLLILAAGPSVQIQASIDGSPPRAGWAYAKAGSTVTLQVVVRGAKPSHVRWYSIEATADALDNTTPSFHFEPVPYEERERTDCSDQLTCPAGPVSERSELPAALAKVGAWAYRVEVVTDDGRTVSTPGASSIEYGGLTPDVFRVAFRGDDTVLGYAMELVNTPYIFGSAGPDGRNQSDRLIGSDCADLIIYGRRRSGKKATYTSSYAIDRQAPEVKKGAPQRGDLVHFPSRRHVALLFEDREPVGVLDENDLIFHTCWARPTVQRIGDTGCTAPPYRLLRFPSTQ